MDRASSAHPAVQRQIDRLTRLSPGRDILGLERITELLGRLGDPHRELPPVLHVAGTNGKGSTCAFLRSAIEAAGLTTHVYTSPHLVRFNERIRLAGHLIDDEALADLLREALDAAAGMQISFFEATTAAAFLAFARVPADACIVEVGLGGRLDATNVVQRPLVCGIAQLGLDHAAFLGDRIEEVAAEKAGIAKAGVNLLTQAYPAPVAERVATTARQAGSTWLPRGDAWRAGADDRRLLYQDRAGELSLPLPRMPGVHQAMNAALAVAMLRHQDQLEIGKSAFEAAMGTAQWPARLQRLRSGPLHDRLPPGSELWLDGAHNPSAARAVANHFRAAFPPDRPFHLVLGLLTSKAVTGVLRAFDRSSIHVHTVPVPGHDHVPPRALADLARAEGFFGSSYSNVGSALATIARQAEGDRPPVVLIMGSLYLAGEVLSENGPLPA
jgi:dihydrofolate synthase/folylpolyglutamate synthase